MIGGSRKWAYMRIIAGTIVGGVLGFYVMHRVELGYKVTPLLFNLSSLIISGPIPLMIFFLKVMCGMIAEFFSFLFILDLICLLGMMQEKMKERLKQYENELKKKEQMKELEDSLQCEYRTFFLVGCSDFTEPKLKFEGFLHRLQKLTA